MPDDKTKTKPQDASRIAMHEPYEVNWWTHELGCTKEKLQRAVNAVGHMAADVRAWLKKN
jgi:hypothetical protein